MSRRAETGLGPAHLLVRLTQVLHIGTVEALRSMMRREPWPEAVYRAVVRLGPTAMKLGQVASTRPDLVPEALATRLHGLQEQAPPFPHGEALQVIEAELGPVETVFRTFPSTPAAAASLSQVYFATLTDGTPVAVKVQRPNIALPIQRDALLLQWLARVASWLRPSLRRLRLRDAAEEFGRWTWEELDFRKEARNAETFRTNFAERAGVTFPKIHWSHTSGRVLTMERVTGLRVGEIAANTAVQVRDRIVDTLSNCLMRMFVTDGFFHADLHPGNVFFNENGEVILLDMGMVGRLTVHDRDRFLAYWLAITRRQRDRAFHHLLRMGEASPAADVSRYRRAFNGYLDLFYASTISERSLARTYLDIFTAGARYGVTFPSHLLLQAKAILTMESLALTLMPGFRFADRVRPVVADALATRSGSRSLKAVLWRGAADWLLLDEAVGLGALPDASSEDERAFRREARTALLNGWTDELDGWLSKWQTRLANPAYGAESPEAREAEILLKHGVRALRISAGLIHRVESGSTRPAATVSMPTGGADGAARWRAFLAQSRGGPFSASETDAYTADASSEPWRLDPWERAGVVAALAGLRVCVARLSQAFVELSD